MTFQFLLNALSICPKFTVIVCIDMMSTVFLKSMLYLISTKGKGIPTASVIPAKFTTRVQLNAHLCLERSGVHSVFPFSFVQY